MIPRRPHLLSKSRFIAGLQCLKRLYLECNHRELADPVSPGQQAIFDAGTAVGELARRRFPGGILVEEEFLKHAQAVQTTEELLLDPSVPALYEAAFTSDGVRTRVDVLSRVNDLEFDLVEVKSGTRVRDEHIWDVAIQMHVVEASGVTIRCAYLMHIDNTYVYSGGDHDLDQLFSLEDVTDEVRAYAESEMAGDLARMWESLENDETLAIKAGPHCKIPYVCPFFGHCHRDEPEHSIRELPRLSQELRGRLKTSGIDGIVDIPPGFTGLSGMQRRVLNSVISGDPYVGPELASRLTEITFPASFLDFEALSPAVPLYRGTRPYQPVPFQWSLHVLESEGGLTHRAFLDDGQGDPRERFVTSLLNAVPPEGSIATYSSYEIGVMTGLAQSLPLYEDRLLELCGRVIDLLQVIRSNYYRPGFHGSFSLKSVVPALIPDLKYDDLDIPEGLTASAAYAGLVACKTPDSDRRTIREALLAYCARDTEVMVRLYKALLAESS